MWRNRATPDVADGEALDTAAEAAVLGRLRRVSGQSGMHDATVAETAAVIPACFADSVLLRNAFAVTGVVLDASAAVISDAVDDLSFTPGQDPDALNAARAALLSARDRLDEELTWLPELSPTALVAVRAGLAAGDVAAVTTARDGTIGLARLNLSLALALAVPGDIDRATRVLGDGRAWDPNTTLGPLAEARARAGFRPIDDDIYDRAVQAHALSVARSLAPLFAVSTSARTALTRAMQAAGEGGSGTFAAMFLDEVLRCYAAGIDPALEAAAVKIAAAATALRERPDDPSQAIALTAALEIWSSLRRPVQVHEAARGLDDPDSAEIFESVRSLTVTLSNDHQEYDTALRLARALIASFALVPFHRAALEQQLPTLIGNVLIKRLRQACAQALAAPSRFAREVMAGGLARPGGLAGQVAVAFAEGTDTGDAEERGAMFLLVRGLAVDLCNEHRERRAALRITEWLLLLDPPADVYARLTDDVGQLGGEVPAGAPASSRPSDGEPAAPASFGRARRGDAPPPTQAPSWLSQPAKPPPPTRAPPRRRGKVPVTVQVALGLCVLTSFCSRGSPRTDPVATPDTPRAVQDVYAVPDRSGERALEARIRGYNARLKAGEPVAPVSGPRRIVPGRPMNDAHPMDPGAPVDSAGYQQDAP